MHTLVVSLKTENDDEPSATFKGSTLFRVQGDASGACWLVTNLDALRFETGRRSVELWFVGPEPAGSKGAAVKARLEGIDSYRFRWTPRSPALGFLQLTSEEAAMAERAGAVLTWASDRELAATANALRTASVTEFGDGNSATTRCESVQTGEVAASRDFTEIAPILDDSYVALPFFGEKLENPRLVAIGLDPGAPYGPSGVSRVLGYAAITAILGESRSVEDRAMLERELPRWKNLAGYQDLIAFASRKGFSNFLSWRIRDCKGSESRDTYRPFTTPTDGPRVMAVVSEDPNADATVELRGPSNNGLGREQHPARDAAICVRSAADGKAAVRVTTITKAKSATSEPSAASRLLFLEIIPRVDGASPMPTAR